MSLSSTKTTGPVAYGKGRENGAAFLTGIMPRLLASHARGLAKELGWPVGTLLGNVTAYDRERLEAVPDLTKYPELRGCRDQLTAQDQGMLDAGVSREMIALSRTLDFYVHTRLYQETGRAWYFEPSLEECRILYVPDSEIGPIHAKNVDGPLGGLKPLPPTPKGTPWFWNHPIVLDGVGSGLHIDEIPPEIFPANIYDLCYGHCTTVSAATELLTRYNCFWGHGNLLVHDYHGNSAAFEKTQCRVGVRAPDKHGMSFISGMAAIDPCIREHHRRMRLKYLDQIGADWTGPDGCFWKECEATLDHMAVCVERLSARPTLREVNELMERHEPGHPLCFTGEKSHPDQAAGCWTVEMRLFLLNERKCFRRQVRDGKPAYLDPPELIEYGS